MEYQRLALGARNSLNEIDSLPERSFGSDRHPVGLPWSKLVVDPEPHQVRAELHGIASRDAAQR